MRFFSIDACVGFAKRAEPLFHVFYQLISQSGLFLSGMFAYRAGIPAELRQPKVSFFAIQFKSPLGLSG